MRTRLIRSMGFDPGLRHGSLVSTDFEASYNEKTEDVDLNLIRWSILYTWTQKSPYSLSERCTPNQISILTSQLLNSTLELGIVINPLNNKHQVSIGVDWDPVSVHWHSRKLQMSKLSFFLGYFSAVFHVHGFPCIYVSPTRVRTFFGLSRQSKKQEVWNRITGIVSLDTIKRDPRVQDEMKKDGDIMDAFLLSYLVAKERAYRLFLKELQRNPKDPTPIPE